MAAITTVQSPTLNHYLLLVLLLQLTSYATPLTFNFSTLQQSDNTNANATASLVAEGDAVIGNQSIHLTKDNVSGGEPRINGSVGRATYREPFLLRDSATGKLADFTTYFEFIINDRNRTVHSSAEGLAFFIAPNGSLLNRVNRLGLPVNRSVDQYPFVAVEFDPWSAVEDLEGGHVGIDVNCVESSITRPWDGGILEGKLNRAWISYNSSSKNLSVAFTTYVNNSQEQVASSLSYMVDLNKYLPDLVIVGFSASTDSAPALHKIISWNFTTLMVQDASLVLSGQEKKQESPVPPPGLSSQAKRRKHKKLLVVVISSTAGGGLILLFVLGLGVFNSCKKPATRARTEYNLVIPQDLINQFEKDLGRPKQFSYNELASATRQFSKEEKLGDEELGIFYRGYLKDFNSCIAVHKISAGSKHVAKAIETEIMTISRVRHRNLLQLTGWCHEKGQLLLVYEFMPNGTLDSQLFKETSMLVWEVRYKIAQGLACGLLYLHEELERCVVHRDINPGNIMLDSNFNAKLRGFGLAKLVDHEELHGFELAKLVDHEEQMETMVVAGTLGYIAPEYLITLKASKETDVYSFGVVVLQIACGRKPINPMLEGTEFSMVEWVWKLYGEGKILEAADPKLNGDFDEKQLECLMIVGLWCAHPYYDSRPPIQRAIQALNFEVPLPILPSKMPGDIVSYATSYTESSSTANSEGGQTEPEPPAMVTAPSSSEITEPSATKPRQD